MQKTPAVQPGVDGPVAVQVGGPMVPVQAQVVSVPQMQLMMVTVPPGVPMGGVFAVATPSGQHVQVQAQVPEGQQMQVQVPM